MLLANITAEVGSFCFLLQTMKQEAKGIGFNVTAEQTKFTSFNQDD